MVLVRRDRLRQAILPPKPINGPSLAVVVGKDDGTRTKFFGQSVVVMRDLGNHLFPSKLIAEVLRQWAVMGDLAFWRLDVQALLVDQEPVGRENWQSQWR